MNALKKIRSYLLISALMITLSSLPGLCLADNYATPGTYFIFGGLTGFEDFQNTGVDDFKDAWGIEFRVGHRFNKYLAAEGDLGMMNGFDATINLSDLNPNLSGTDKVTIDTLILTANLKAHLPLGRLDPYALIGAGIMYANVRSYYPTGYVCWPGYYGWYCSDAYASIDDATAFVTKFGVGTDIHLNRQWAISLDVSYVVPYSKLSDLRYTSFAWGIRYAY